MSSDSIDAIVVVDMQDYFLKILPDYIKNDIVSAQLDVLDACDEYDIPVAAVEYDGRDKTISIIIDSIMGLNRYSIMKKTTTDGFFRTPLHDILKEWNAKNLCFMGVYAGCCVKHTARRLVKAMIPIIEMMY